MAKSKVTQMERVTVTLPRTLLDQVESQLAVEMYASLSEWIRAAIREHLARQRSPMQAVIDRDPRVLESLKEAKEGKTRQFDLQRIKKKAGN